MSSKTRLQRICALLNARLIMATIKIPRRPQKAIDGLKKEEMDCLNWYVIFGDPLEECYARFVVPQFKDNPKLLREYAKQFAAGAQVKEYIAAYKEELDSVGVEKQRVVASARKKADESDEDYSTRRKRESVEKVMAKIADMVDDIGDAETLLDTVKAMKDTGYFENAVVASPPGRYLPISCNQCEYKAFIDKHVKSGDIEQTPELDSEINQ